MVDAVWRWVVDAAVVLVYFSVSPQVGNNGEVASATLDFTSKCYDIVRKTIPVDSQK